MRTRAGGDGVTAAVHEVVERTRTIARLEAELAVLELRRKARAAAAGTAVLVLAAVLGLFGLAYLTATAAAALATALPTWAALLLVGAALLLAALAAGAAGLALVRRATPPVPTAAVEEARLTAQALGGNGHG
jgi:protein-S-isoprenylcysteine O-methyltransferase Ste14